MSGWLGRVGHVLGHAFSVRGSGRAVSAEDEALLDRVAGYVVAHRMAAPAILFLESMRPLNFVGSQVLVFLRPMLASFFTAREYERLAEILEKRTSVDALIARIEKPPVAQPGPEGRPRRGVGGTSPTRR